MRPFSGLSGLTWIFTFTGADMKEAYFDPALQKHRERQALIHKWQARRALFKKYRVLIASNTASVSMVAALFFWKIYPLIQEHL